MNLDHPALQRRLVAGGGDMDSGIRKAIGADRRRAYSTHLRVI
jgi:hypothetical protein